MEVLPEDISSRESWQHYQVIFESCDCQDNCSTSADFSLIALIFSSVSGTPGLERETLIYDRWHPYTFITNYYTFAPHSTMNSVLAPFLATAIEDLQVLRVSYIKLSW